MQLKVSQFVFQRSGFILRLFLLWGETPFFAESPRDDATSCITDVDGLISKKDDFHFDSIWISWGNWWQSISLCVLTSETGKKFFWNLQMPCGFESNFKSQCEPFTSYLWIWRKLFVDQEMVLENVSFFFKVRSIHIKRGGTAILSWCSIFVSCWNRLAIDRTSWRSFLVDAQGHFEL